MTSETRPKLCAITLAALCLVSADVTVQANEALSSDAGSKSSDSPIASLDPQSNLKSQAQPNLKGPISAPKNSSALRQPKPSSKKKEPYAQEKQIQANPTPVGTAPVLPVPTGVFAVPGVSDMGPAPKNDITLSETPIKGLVSIDRRLSPFGLDAAYSQQVTLRDVLQATLTGNLDITDTHASAQIQKYTYLQSLAKFLPDATMNYSRIEADGTVKTPGGLFGAPGGVQTLRINNPFTIASAGFTYRGYQGGSVLFGAIQSKHRLRAARKQLEGTTNDALLAAAQNYYNLLLNEALLQIRVKAVERSQEQVNQNTQLETNGLATYLDVLQARTQLARDRQDLLTQQSARRVSAIQLAHTLNISLGQDLIPVGRIVRKERIISGDLLITDLLKIAVDNRPELKQFEALRKAAKAQIAINAAPLQPQVTLTGNVFGIGTTLNQLGSLFVLNLGVNWTLGNLGLSDTANIQTARWQARQALIKANKQFVDVFEQVRTSYADTLTAEQKIEQTNEQVASAKEELRLARLRLDTGLGTNLDVLTAQRDLTQAFIDQAQAVINFNQTQVKLAHDIGLVTVESLTSGRLIGADVIK
jgi:outer membrane protein TolC